ncbi:MAG: hypothetical protein M1816_000452 [Peltula sp. TS41687]|nr:MAG: hypothetical protein M1816_000452 [Peltula sp. TS41687]
MPATTPIENNKTRQSSTGKSFFSRARLHKDRTGEKRSVSDESRLPPENASIGGSSVGSRSSRHTHRSSITEIDRSDLGEADPSGLAVTVGVITSVPYDSVAEDSSRTPIPVDYLPRGDQKTMQREPLPHHLNRGGRDYHQYPAVNPSGQASHPSGPRPPPPGSSANSVYGERSTSLPRQGSVASTGRANGAHFGTVNSFSTTDSSINPRTSFDQASIHSSLSSATRESSIFSSSNSSHTAIPQSHIDNHALSPAISRSSIASRQSQHNHGFFSYHHPSGFSSTGTLHNEGFSLPRPSDEVIEQQFLALMQKRGSQNIPEQARRQMLAYPASKKWTLIYQDKLTEWQGEQKRRTHARQTVVGSDGQWTAMARADEEGSPEWYVKRVMNDSISAKQLSSLSVSLRTQPISWVKSFVEAQGQVALTNVLAKIGRRQARGPAPAGGSTSDKDLDREYDILKCLKALMNNKYGADDALRHQQVIVALANSLTSPRLSTRKLVSEVLTFLCHWADGHGHRKVLQALDHVKSVQGEHGRFDAWMRIVEVTIDGRGKMGSLVGASEEVRSGGIGMENLLMEYAVATMLLINMIVDAPETDVQLRCHIRAQFTACGIKRILTKMEGFQYDVIDTQIKRYRINEGIDYEDIMERDTGSFKDGVEPERKDLNDPVEIVDAIMSRVRGTRTQDYFLSTMQHLLLIRENNGEDRLRMFQLVDAMLSYVAMDRRLPDMDLKQSLNFSVQNLLDKLHTDAEARQAQDEAVQSRQIADSAMAERDEMRSQVELGADGMVAKLQKQLDEQTAVIEVQKRQNEVLKGEMTELHRVRAQELQRNELETRELYLMLRDAQDVAASAAKKDAKNGLAPSDPTQMKGILDRGKLMDRLEMQLERQKTQFKLEGRVWQQTGPSDQLRELREEMDGDDRNKDELMEQTRSKMSSGTLGSVPRKTAVGPEPPLTSLPATIPESAEDAAQSSDRGDDHSEESVIYEKPRLVELKRPKTTQRQPTGLLNEIASKVRKFDASDDEDADGDGVTTGPTHPSLEPDSPKTPSDGDLPKVDEQGAKSPLPPPSTEVPALSEPSSSPHQFTSPMPGFENCPPPPPPPPLPSRPGSSGSSIMPGFSNAVPPPPPPPPLPAKFKSALAKSSAAAGSMPPPPPPLPPIPGAPPLPGARVPNIFSPISAPPSPLFPVARPKKKLKALHWEKVDTPQVTIWASHAPTYEEKEEKYLELTKKGVLEEVEKLFLAKEIKQIGKSSGKKSDKKQIISNDLKWTFQISLAKFSQHSVDKILQMIIHCDREVLDDHVVMDFLQKEDMCNIPENVAKSMAPYSRDWTGPHSSTETTEQDPSELSREDQIYLQTAFELHHYWKSRMRALALTRSYESDYEHVSDKLKLIVRVSESLKNSASLGNVLGLILDIGNYMNDTSKQATGFKLSSLARLAMVKDDKNESTFADLVERIVRTQFPEWADFLKEISEVVTAQNLHVDQIEQDAKKYIDNIKNVQMSLDSGNLSDPKRFHPQDRVSQVVQRSMKEARRKADQMQLYLDEMMRTYRDVMTFYGEDKTDENARRDFFPKLAGFVTEWKKSKEKNLTMEEARKRNEASMRRKRNQNSQANGSDESGATSPTTTGAMDSLLEKLRAAAPLARDQRDRRRRARLKDRHQVRIASGQTVPDLPDFKGDIDGGGPSSQENADGEPDGTSQEIMVNGDDVADRAAMLLLGLRSSEGSEGTEGLETSGFNSMRVRQRIDSASDERRARRSRRGLAGGSSSSGRSGSFDDGGSLHVAKREVLGENGVIPENHSLGGGGGGGEEDESGGSNEPTLSNIPGTDLSPPRINDALSTSAPPTTVIIPPSPG